MSTYSYVKAFLWCLRYAKRRGAREREKRKERGKEKRKKTRERRGDVIFPQPLIIFKYSTREEKSITMKLKHKMLISYFK
jgi:hypothetical protein